MFDSQSGTTNKLKGLSEVIEHFRGIATSSPTSQCLVYKISCMQACCWICVLESVLLCLLDSLNSLQEQ